MSEGQSDLTGLLVAFGIQFAIASGLFTSFSLLRSHYKKVYEPKIQFGTDTRKPEPIQDGALSWILPVLRKKELDAAHIIGPDSTMFIRFTRFCFDFFAGILVFSIPLTVFNCYAPQISGLPGINGRSTDNTTAVANPDLNSLSMQNLNPDSPWVFLYVFVAYVFSFYAYYLLYYVWKDYVKVCKNYFKSPDYLNAYYNRTLLFSALPPLLKNEEHMMFFIKSLALDDPIEQVVMGRNFENTSLLISRHSKAVKKMEYLLMNYYESLEKGNKSTARPMHRDTSLLRSLCLYFGDKKDSINECSKELQLLEDEIYRLRARGDENFDTVPYAFISFRSIVACQKALNKLSDRFYLHERTGHYFTPKIKSCLDFRDLIWENLSTPRELLFTRKVVGNLVIAGLTFGWTFIVAFVATLTQVETIAQFSPQVADQIRSSPFAITFLQAVVAPVLLILLNLILPIVFRIVTRQSGVTSINGVEKSVLRKYFWFQLYQVFVFVGLSSIMPVILSRIQSGGVNGLISASDVLFQQAISGFVSSSTFFITTIVVGYTAYGIEIIQGIPLFFNLITVTFFKLTPRSNYELNQPPSFDFMASYGVILYSFMIAAMYSVISPLITPFACVLFGIAHLVLKYQLYYVYETKLESGGGWWPKVFSMIIFCICLFQFLTFGSIGIMLSKRSSKSYANIASILVGILVLFSVLIWILYKKLFLSKSKVMDELILPSNPFHLDEYISDPTIACPLMKVWTLPKYTEKSRQEYEPNYLSTLDYMNQQCIDTPGYQLHKRRMRNRIQNYGLSMTKEWEGREETPPPEWTCALEHATICKQELILAPQNQHELDRIVSLDETLEEPLETHSSVHIEIYSIMAIAGLAGVVSQSYSHHQSHNKR